MHATRMGAAGADLARLFELGAAGSLGDTDLLRRFVEGRGDGSSEAAFKAIVERHGGLVRGVCRRILWDSHAADDVAQSVFLVLARRASGIRCDGSLAPWLHGVSVRIARRAQSSTATAPVALPDGLDLSGPPPEPGPAERAEVMAAIDAEISRLPGRQRAAVILCHMEGLDHREAARQLRCPLGTLESRLHRARQRLRRGLIRRGLAPAGLAAALAAAEGSARASLPASFAASAAVRLAVLGRGALPASTVQLELGPLGRLPKVKAAAFAGLIVLGGGAAMSALGNQGGAGGPTHVEVGEVPQAGPVAAPALPSVAEQIRAVFAELKRFERANRRILILNKDASDRRFRALEDKIVECSEKVLRLVESEPSDRACLDAMLWHVSQYWISGTHGKIDDQLVRSVDVLLRHYGDEPRVAWRVLVSRNGMPTRLDDRLLPGLVAAARCREAKGLALMALASYLEDKAGFVIRVQKNEGPFDLELDSLWGGKSRTSPYDAAYERTLRSCDAAVIRHEAESVLARIVAEYGDVVKAGRDPGNPESLLWTDPAAIGEEAAGRLAALRGVAVGKPAPDLSWSNRDGSTSRLSDFRGKVVVLAFWHGGVDSVSHFEFEREARLARNMKGRPFVLIGFSRKDAEGRDLSLPFARPDGSDAVPADGPILERLGVRRFPATIVIDADGVLCFQCGYSILLDGYLRDLVADAEAKADRVQGRGRHGR